MPFRRQDIPKTTRRSKEDGSRRLYPRILRDKAMVPRVEQMLAYLDAMVGRRRGDLQSDAVLDLIGDARLARCLLACVHGTYRYRPGELSDVIGEQRAANLAEWDLLTPADLRRYVFLEVNRRFDGAVGFNRDLVLTEIGETLNVTHDELATMLFLDAERNETLVRYGPRPTAEDVIARYNVLVLVSTLRHASRIELTLPGIERMLVDVLSRRYEVPVQWQGRDTVVIRGKRSENGTYGGFGGRVARVAAHLLLAAPSEVTGEAKVHLGSQTGTVIFDDRLLAPLRRPGRVVADAAGVIRAWELSEAIATWRKAGKSMDGWTVRRALEPTVVDGAILLPELTLTRDHFAVPLAVPSASANVAALSDVAATVPLVAFGRVAEQPGIVPITQADPSLLLDALERITAASETPVDARQRVIHLLHEHGWISSARLRELAGEGADTGPLVAALLATGEAVEVPSVGVCRVALLDELMATATESTLTGPPVTRVREAAVRLLGDQAAADALTLHLLSDATFWQLPHAA